MCALTKQCQNGSTRPSSSGLFFALSNSGQHRNTASVILTLALMLAGFRFSSAASQDFTLLRLKSGSWCKTFQQNFSIIMIVLTFSNSQSSRSVKLHHSFLLQHLIHTKPPQQQLQRAAVFNEGLRAPPSLSPESIIVFCLLKLRYGYCFVCCCCC